MTGNRFQSGSVLPLCSRSEGSTEKKWLCEGSARGNYDPREGQQRFPSNPSGFGDRTTTLRRLLIDAVRIASRKKLGVRIFFYILESQLKKVTLCLE